MKNVLKEIKNDIISKGDEPRVDNIEQYISQNKIFCLLFYSNIIPEYLNILSSLKIINNNDNLKLIICICNDSEEDYNKTISEMNDISCLILNYNSKNKEYLIDNYNVISLPKLIVLNKDGEIIDNLSSQRIKILYKDGKINL